MFTTTVIVIFYLIVLIFSVVTHELAHGYVAYSLGDPTAKYEGRLTLNPLKHLDIFGSVFLPIMLLITTWALPGGPFIFGWAKPVPINPYNFRDKKYGEIKVSIAGPASNFLLAIFFGLILRFIPTSVLVLNPGIEIAITMIVYTNILLAVFNLIPIPPLDGSWILFNLLPARLENVKNFLRQYGVVIMVLLILFAGQLWFAITSILFQIITGHVLTL
jgi:Zn-dependent protease